jgi:hypothetical protein
VFGIVDERAIWRHHGPRMQTRTILPVRDHKDSDK